MKKLMLCLTAVLIAALIPAGSIAEEARGFETPEACAQALFAALQAQDVEAMENCIAFDELAERFDFQAHAERMGAIANFTVFVPPDDPFAVEYNRTMLRRTWYLRLEATNMFVVDWVLAEALFYGKVIRQNTEEFSSALQTLEQSAGFNVYALMTYDGIITPDEIAGIRDTYHSDKNKEVMRKTMAVWQIDNYVEFGIKISSSVDIAYAAGSQYIIPLRFVEIGGRWLADPNAPALGLMLGMNSVSLLAELP